MNDKLIRLSRTSLHRRPTGVNIVRETSWKTRLFVLTSTLSRLVCTGQPIGARRRLGRVHLVQVLGDFGILGPGRGQQYTDRRQVGNVRGRHRRRRRR